MNLVMFHQHIFINRLIIILNIPNFGVLNQRCKRVNKTIS